MKLFERLRWLPTDRPTPCTADVSAKSWVLLMLGGATAGASTAMSRKLRPLSGRLLTSCRGTVVATWLRADSRIGASALTVTEVDTPSTEMTIGMSKAEPSVSARRRVAGAKPAWATESSYGPTRR